MKQSDHSMLPPTPAATIAFGSPNACNNCHGDKNSAWADEQVRIWYAKDYQSALLKRARLIDDARKGIWEKLPDMLDYIQSKDRDEVFATSLIRCMFKNEDKRILPVLLTAAKDRSPLVRSAAIQGLGYRPLPESRPELLYAANNDYRAVRISAAYGLTTYPFLGNSAERGHKGINTAVDELLVSLMLNPDQWTSYEVAGNVYTTRGRFKEAESAYLTALRINPRAVSIMVSLSNIYLKQRENVKAKEILDHAIKIDPNNTAAIRSLEALQSQRKYIGDEKESQ